MPSQPPRVLHLSAGVAYDLLPLIPRCHPNTRFTVVELNKALIPQLIENLKSVGRTTHHFTVIQGDQFTYNFEGHYDVVLNQPPWELKQPDIWLSNLRLLAKLGNVSTTKVLFMPAHYLKAFDCLDRQQVAWSQHQVLSGTGRSTLEHRTPTPIAFVCFRGVMRTGWCDFLEGVMRQQNMFAPQDLLHPFNPDLRRKHPVSSTTAQEQPAFVSRADVSRDQRPAGKMSVSSKPFKPGESTNQKMVSSKKVGNPRNSKKFEKRRDKYGNHHSQQMK